MLSTLRVYVACVCVCMWCASVNTFNGLQHIHRTQQPWLIIKKTEKRNFFMQFFLTLSLTLTRFLQVHFANLSPPDSPMSESQATLNGKAANENGNLCARSPIGHTLCIHLILLWTCFVLLFLQSCWKYLPVRQSHFKRRAMNCSAQLTLQMWWNIPLRTR